MGGGGGGGAPILNSTQAPKALNPHPVSATLPPPRHPDPNAGKTLGQSHTQLVEEQKQEQKKRERRQKPYLTLCCYAVCTHGLPER